MPNKFMIARKTSAFDEIVLENPKPVILVGTSSKPDYMAELNSIEISVRKTGLEVLRTKNAWPRGQYAVLGNTYLPAQEFGDAARGGAYFFREGLIAASEGVSNRYGTREIPQKALGGETKMYYLPPFQFLIGDENQPMERIIHIYEDLDYFSALVNGTLLFVDEVYYKLNKPVLDEICMNHGIRISLLPHDEYKHMPANLLEINVNGKTTVITNGHASQSIELMKKEGLDVIAAYLSALPSGLPERGAVTCATNFVHDKRLLPYLGVNLA